ncbi:PLAC8-like protein 1 [Nibea albiflora]|uniref:PLAC8-like protein 1 n=1 Tax=Nibea albiflora TaxID=240163 RepID=A0ACB7EVB6_NIBAL|nr:PLAC8-like protein 1 [Nibea albiflora]
MAEVTQWLERMEEAQSVDCLEMVDGEQASRWQEVKMVVRDRWDQGNVPRSRHRQRQVNPTQGWGKQGVTTTSIVTAAHYGRVGDEVEEEQHREGHDMAVQQQVSSVMATQGSADWSTELFHCCRDKKTCCYGLCCFPCMQCETTKDFGWFFLLPLLDFGGLISMSLRFSMRERYDIRGSFVDDCFKVCCCYPCVWCQMHRELKIRQ